MIKIDYLEAVTLRNNDLPDQPITKMLPRAYDAYDFCVLAIEHRENEDNKEMSERLRGMVTKVTYMVTASIVICGHMGTAFVKECDSEEEAVKAYNEVIAAEARGDKVYSFWRSKDVELKEVDSATSPFELTEFHNEEEYVRLRKMFLDAIQKEFGSDIHEQYDESISKEDMRSAKEYGSYTVEKRDGELQEADDLVYLLTMQATEHIKIVGGKVLVARLIIKEGTLMIPLDANGEPIDTDDDGTPVGDIEVASWDTAPIYTIGWKIDIKH